MPQHVGHPFLDHAIDGLRKRAVYRVEAGVDIRRDLDVGRLRTRLRDQRLNTPLQPQFVEVERPQMIEDAPVGLLQRFDRLQDASAWGRRACHRQAEWPPAPPRHWREFQTAAGRVRREARARCRGVRRPAATPSGAAGSCCPGSAYRAWSPVHWLPRCSGGFPAALTAECVGRNGPAASGVRPALSACREPSVEPAVV